MNIPLTFLLLLGVILACVHAADDNLCTTTGTRDASCLRDYSHETEDSRVRKHYKDMRSYQSEDFVGRMERKWTSFQHKNMTLRQAFKFLENYVDASDPDVSLPNVVHNFMAAEAARRAGAPDWMQLTALLHDLGKIMFVAGEESDGMSGRADGPQWALGGDTWVLGQAIPNSVVYPEFNRLNPDFGKPNRFANGTGVRNLRFPFGHDEYAYRFLLHGPNGCKLPEDALQIVRLHSCYPLHTERAYDHLLKPGDEDLLRAVIDFNKYDLYSKTDKKISDMEELWPYYESLMDKYFVGGAKGELHF